MTTSLSWQSMVVGYTLPNKISIESKIILIYAYIHIYIYTPHPIYQASLYDYTCSYKQIYSFVQGYESVNQCVMAYEKRMPSSQEAPLPRLIVSCMTTLKFRKLQYYKLCSASQNHTILSPILQHRWTSLSIQNLDQYRSDLGTWRYRQLPNSSVDDTEKLTDKASQVL